MLKVHHVGIWVRDLDRSGRFYQQVMGFEKQYGYRIPAEVVERIFGPETDCRVEVYHRDEVSLELFQPDQKIPEHGPHPLAPAINHFGLKVGDKRAFCREVVGKGAQIIEVEREDHSVYFIRDPDGILIEIKDK
jgi:catechol 2,3-dioxygenase-like lactoylglutathione lyase family enzyme